MASIDHASHINEQLSAYLDGELSPRERREVEGHLKVCANCQAEYEALQEVAELASESLRASRCISAADKAAYIHGLMNEEMCRKIESHLAKCHNCQSEMEQLKEWVEEPIDPQEAGEPAPHRKKQNNLGRFFTVLFPLAAAAAIVIGLASTLLTRPSGPAITAISIQNAATRNSGDSGEIDVEFAQEHPLHTNDSIKLRLDPGRYNHAVVFLMNATGNVYTLTFGPLSDPRYAGRGSEGEIVLPSATQGWQLGSTVGTDVIFVVFADEPLAGDTARKAKAQQALSETGPPPELPYGSIVWLDQKGRWTSNESARLDTLVAALKKALVGCDIACRGIAFAHE